MATGAGEQSAGKRTRVPGLLTLPRRPVPRGRRSGSDMGPREVRVFRPGGTIR